MFCIIGGASGFTRSECWWLVVTGGAFVGCVGGLVVTGGAFVGGFWAKLRCFVSSVVPVVSCGFGCALAVVPVVSIGSVTLRRWCLRFHAVWVCAGSGVSGFVWGRTRAGSGVSGFDAVSLVLLGVDHLNRLSARAATCMWLARHNACPQSGVFGNSLGAAVAHGTCCCLVGPLSADCDQNLGDDLVDDAQI